jgi:hypothetical protein
MSRSHVRKNLTTDNDLHWTPGNKQTPAEYLLADVRSNNPGRQCGDSSDNFYDWTRTDVGVRVDHTVIRPANVLVTPLDPEVSARPALNA